MAAADSENLKQYYEGVIKHNPNNPDAVAFLAVWHLERQSFQQARKFYTQLATIRRESADVWLCLCICCVLGDDIKSSIHSLTEARRVIRTPVEEVRLRFCYALLLEKQKDFPGAMEGYTLCLNQCSTLSTAVNEESNEAIITEMEKNQRIGFLKDIRGEVMLRIALLKKEMGALDQSMQLCNTITLEFNDSIRANALCLKGLIHEVKAEYPTSEIVYRSVLSIKGDHCIALERLGRVYLRYRETIPAAVQCFFKAVEVNPSNHVAWYLLGRCYMATSQYSDACEAYNRSINLNPNDAQTWCSLGVLYYAFGQYREALGMLVKALKLNPKMADAWYNVGALYEMCDQPEDAQMAYQKAKEHGLGERFSKAGLGMTPIGGMNSGVNQNAAAATATAAQNPLAAVANTPAINLGAAAAAVLQQQQQQLQRQQMSHHHQQMLQQVHEQVAAAAAAVSSSSTHQISNSTNADDHRSAQPSPNEQPPFQPVPSGGILSKTSPDA